MYSPIVERGNNDFHQAFNRPLDFFGVQRLSEESDHHSSLYGQLMESEDEDLLMADDFNFEIEKMVIPQKEQFVACSKLDFELISDCTCLTPTKLKSSSISPRSAKEERLAEELSSDESELSDFWMKEDLHEQVENKLTFELKADQ